MTHQRGWCPTCAGPLWRDPRDDGYVDQVTGCRLCQLEAYARVLADIQRNWRRPLPMADTATCNSTQNTAATSRWEPDNVDPYGWRIDWRWTRGLSDEQLLDGWLWAVTAGPLEMKPGWMVTVQWPPSSSRRGRVA